MGGGAERDDACPVQRLALGIRGRDLREFRSAAARIAFDASRGREYLAAGLFCGFALGTKYTALVAVVLLPVCVAAGWELSSEGEWRSASQKLAIICAGAGAIAMPFYVRNWILLGSPIYPPPPVLSRFVHVKYLSPDAISAFQAYTYKRGSGLGHGLIAYLLLPFKLTYETAYFQGAGGIGLAPLALGPLGLIASRQNKFSVYLPCLRFFSPRRGLSPTRNRVF